MLSSKNLPQVRSKQHMPTVYAAWQVRNIEATLQPVLASG
jgi:hypothetical protein